MRGEQTKLMTSIQTDMQRASKKQDYESAARLRNQLTDLKSFGKQMVFGDTEAFDLSRDQALMGLAERLGLPGAPRRIEAYDISHLGGVDNVASMVVFTDGVPNRDDYRRFKMNLAGNDDYAHMREVIARRFGPKHATEWPKPDLLLIDGGQPQLSAALGVLDGLGLDIPAIGLAKREEEIIRRIAVDHYESILMPHTSHVLQLLQRVRDEAHRFAITYQTILRGKRQTSSLLDEIPGVGPATRKQLIRKFGSVRGVRLATSDELAATIGPVKAATVREYLGNSPIPDDIEPVLASADDMPVSET